MRLSKIISGGQVGADRAGLDWAIENGLDIGGWCPKGRLCEDGVIPAVYTLRETKEATYPPRTRNNVADADATVIFSSWPLGRGSALTERVCKSLGKPYVVVTEALTIHDATTRLLGLVRGYDVKTLNVAGSRSQHYYSFAKEILGKMWSALRVDNARNPGKFLKDRRNPLGLVETKDGREVINFKDATGMPCSFSRAEEVGSIWLSVGETGGMLLAKEQAEKLASALKRWCDTDMFA